MLNRNRALVIGGTGLLGVQMVTTGRARGYETYSLARKNADINIDLTELAPLPDFLSELNPKTIVNCYALLDFLLCG